MVALYPHWGFECWLTLLLQEVEYQAAIAASNAAQEGVAGSLHDNVTEQLATLQAAESNVKCNWSHISMLVMHLQSLSP